MIQLKVQASSCHQQQQAQDSLEIGFNSVRVWTLNTCPCAWMVLHDITDKFSVWLQQRLGRFDTSALVEKSPLPAALSCFPPAQTHLTSSQFMKQAEDDKVMWGWQADLVHLTGPWAPQPVQMREHKGIKMKGLPIPTALKSDERLSMSPSYSLSFGSSKTNGLKLVTKLGVFITIFLRV